MNKSQRLLNMLMFINAKKKFNIRDLTSQFKISKRTVLRDLQELGEFGLPIYSELGVTGGYHLLNEKRLPPLYFSEQEAAGLFFIAESLRHYKYLPFDTEVESALNKFYQYLPTDSKRRIDQLRSSVMFWVPTRELETPFLSDLFNATLNHQIVTVTYESERGASERDIQSIGVYTMNGFWYCPAYCFKSQGYRTFRVDRVTSLKIASNQTSLLDFSDHHIQDWVSSENQISGTDEQAVTILIKLSIRGVIKCRSNSWFSRELTIHEDGTGQIERVIPPTDVPCLIDTVITYGADAVLIKPDSIKNMIMHRMDEIRNLYLNQS
ncbi:YafY family protein [Paenibacillus sp. LjRoot153]|uniref:helix-turn-helix transcriptional regulator n=1 Tax=Paenibacillus sp. LjRoot153 TaxID=3342270 RepID=UPI003ED01BBA